MSKQAFLSALRSEIEAKGYPWASKPGALDAAISPQSGGRPLRHSSEM